MTFITLENSIDEGIPIELYEFSYHTNYWRYTSTDKQVVYNGNTFEPIPIDRGKLSESKEMNKKRLTLTLPRDAGIGELFRLAPPSQVVTLTIFFNHFGDSDFVAAWTGRVLSGRWSQHRLAVVCEPTYTSLKRAGLRRKYQYQCPHVLYGADCGLSSFANEQSGVVVAIDTNIVQVDIATGAEVDYYAGGYIAWTNPDTSITEYRMILSSAADGSLILSYVTIGLNVNNPVRVYRGCSHNIADCKLFNNLDNYGGFPYTPNINPFGGTTLF